MIEHIKNEYNDNFPKLYLTDINSSKINNKCKNSNYAHKNKLFMSFGAIAIILVLLFTSCTGKNKDSSNGDEQKSKPSTVVGTTTQTKSERAEVGDDWGYDDNDGEVSDSSKEVITNSNEKNTATPSSLSTGSTNGNTSQSSSPTVPDDDVDGDIYINSRPPGFVFN